MKLFYSRPSPFARKALVALIETNQINDVSLEEVKISPLEPGDIVPKANPLGKIPTLVMPNGSSLSDSKFICRFINEYNQDRSPIKLYPSDQNIWETLHLEALSDGILEAAVLLVYETRIRPEKLRLKEWTDAQLLKITRTLDYFEKHMPQLKENINMGTLTAAISLDYLDFRHDNINWRHSRKNLFEWHENIKTRKSLIKTTPSD